MIKPKINLKELGFPVIYYISLVVLFLGLLLIVTTFALESLGYEGIILSVLSVMGLTYFGVGLILVIFKRKKLIQFYVKINYHKEMRETLSFHKQEETFETIKQRLTDKNFVYIKNQILYNKVFTFTKVYMQYFVQVKESKNADETILEFLKLLTHVDEFAKGVLKNPNKVMVLILVMDKASKEDLSSIKMRIELSIAMQSDYSRPTITFIPILYDLSLKGFVYRDNTKMNRKNNFKMAMSHMKQLFFNDNNHESFQFYDELQNHTIDEIKKEQKI
jgi:hypothetical protein